MLDLSQRLGDGFSFDELVAVINDDEDFRVALIKSIVAEHPEDLMGHVFLQVGRSKDQTARFGVTKKQV